MSGNSQIGSVTVVWKPGVVNSMQEVLHLLMSSRRYLAYISKSSVWKLEVRMDGYGRPYAMLEIDLSQRSFTGVIGKTGSLSSVPKTS